MENDMEGDVDQKTVIDNTSAVTPDEIPATEVDYLATTIVVLQQSNLKLQRNIIELKRALLEKDTVILSLDTRLISEQTQQLVSDFGLKDGYQIVKDEAGNYLWRRADNTGT